jgi:hypothetical protein
MAPSRIGRLTLGIFDAFPAEAGREAHLLGRVAAGSELLAHPPIVERAEVLVAKLPR